MKVLRKLVGEIYCKLLEKIRKYLPIFILTNVSDILDWLFEFLTNSWKTSNLYFIFRDFTVKFVRQEHFILKPFVIRDEKEFCLKLS